MGLKRRLLGSVERGDRRGRGWCDRVGGWRVVVTFYHGGRADDIIQIDGGFLLQNGLFLDLRLGLWLISHPVRGINL